MREFLGSLMRNAGNDPAIFDGLAAEWRQPTHEARLGRLLVLTFSLELPITDEPWTMFKPTSVAVDTILVLPDGTSTDGGTFVIPP